jgi:murein DD-endopeptidase MepM/ murein hydrolase activator NlpD
MRITKVAFGFFAVGFVAGTFEQAAGLGDAQRGARPPVLIAEGTLAAAVVDSAAIEAAPTQNAPSLTGDPLDSIADEPFHATPPPRVSGGRPLLDMGDASAAEAVAPTLVAALVEATRLETAEPPPTMQPFFALPEEEPLVVPEPQLAERPQEFVMPFEKGRVTSMFNQGRRHPAIDLAGPLGTPVYSTTRKQRVTFAGRRGGYGNLIIARDAQGRQHYYGHLQRIVARVGATLDQGDLLGLLGSTGRSTGPHVHYEVRTRAGRHLDPSKLLFPDRRVRRGYAWNTPRPAGSTRFAARSGQPRPR